MEGATLKPITKYAVTLAVEDTKPESMETTAIEEAMKEAVVKAVRENPDKTYKEIPTWQRKLQRKPRKSTTRYARISAAKALWRSQPNCVIV